MIQTALFVLAHPRYLLVVPGYTGQTRPDMWLVVGMVLLGLLAGAVALRYRNVWGAVLVHVGFNFLIFVPIAGTVTSL